MSKEANEEINYEFQFMANRYTRVITVQSVQTLSLLIRNSLHTDVFRCYNKEQNICKMARWIHVVLHVYIMF